MQKKLEDEINITQAGFRQGRGTRDHIFNMRNIIEKCREYNRDLCACFIDYSKAFDCVQHKKLWQIMKNMGFPSHLIYLIATLYQNQQAAVRVNGETSEWFEVQKGVRQGCILSPNLFNVYAENIMRQVYEDENRTKFDALNIGGYEIPELRYADDTTLLSSTASGLEKTIMSVKSHSEAQNLYLNANKTKIMNTDKTKTKTKITINGEELENVNKFEYLGSMLCNNGDGIKEIKRRLNMALQKLKQMKNIWQGTNRKTKLKLLRACIFPIAIYGCEAWTISQTAAKLITSFEMKCYRRVLKILWTDMKTNKDILAELDIIDKWLLKSVQQRKLKYFGHIKRHDSIEKTILEGDMPDSHS